MTQYKTHTQQVWEAYLDKNQIKHALRCSESKEPIYLIALSRKFVMQSSTHMSKVLDKEVYDKGYVDVVFVYATPKVVGTLFDNTHDKLTLYDANLKSVGCIKRNGGGVIEYEQSYVEYAEDMGMELPTHFGKRSNNPNTHVFVQQFIGLSHKVVEFYLYYCTPLHDKVKDLVRTVENEMLKVYNMSGAEYLNMQFVTRSERKAEWTKEEVLTYISDEIIYVLTNCNKDELNVSYVKSLAELLDRAKHII